LSPHDHGHCKFFRKEKSTVGCPTWILFPARWSARRLMRARWFPPESPVALFRFASQGRLGRDESAEHRAVSRKTLRRAVPSFTVKVRRRPKRAITSKLDSLLSEARSSRAGFDRASHPVAAAVFAAAQADPSPGGCGIVSTGPPSLVPDESSRRALRDAASRVTATVQGQVVGDAGASAA
jgi:hypothetical protein